MTTYIIQVDKGEEVIDKLNRGVEVFGVERGPISIIGAIQQATVSVMPKNNPKDDILRDYDAPFEITGTGEVVDGKVHIHVSMGGEDQVVVGHLHRAIVGDWFVRAYITDMDDVSTL
ncbi:putative DNA-binding protein with PD1-like motif [Catenuloplanes nepalensis]|uniref:DNA-binding protein with PD1-like motif n=1 Tax=Catenuloplanes nepalensis TaxID=587533 RepID=A0ABT9MUU8_9ACTN|nr:PPC domain-containing DNA-binding protein [Catenuloplanes nepalensis]MDP9795212.1 putative DNA-binding protein with PD1-like motif [Catenuloplanes nepalensis]